MNNYEVDEEEFNNLQEEFSEDTFTLPPASTVPTVSKAVAPLPLAPSHTVTVFPPTKMAITTKHT